MKNPSIKAGIIIDTFDRANLMKRTQRAEAPHASSTASVCLKLDLIAD